MNSRPRNVVAASILVSLLVFFSAPVLAYSGFSVSPAISGGPGSNTVTNFEVDTRSSNPQTIDTNLYYVYRVVIETSAPLTSNMLITEEPSSGGGGNPSSFSFSIPAPLEKKLVEATIYFWGPDVDSLTVVHSHQGEPDVVLVATKVSPLQYDPYGNGNVLWQVTTTSFSDFYINPADGGVSARSVSSPPFFFIALLVLLSASSCVLLSKTG